MKYNSGKYENKYSKCKNNKNYDNFYHNNDYFSKENGDFEFKKKFGQNFLSDKNLLEKIADLSNISENDIVVEIGAGKGALTEFLSKKAKKVFSFEIDKELETFLNEKFAGSNVIILSRDIMKVSDDEIEKLLGGEKFYLVANLPYYITSPIITRFLKNKNLISMTVMVQEEVADRIVAETRTKSYGALSVFCQHIGFPKKVLRVSRDKFYPVPDVDSAVIKIDRKSNIDVKTADEYFAFVKKAFSMRRKKLSANLVSERFSKNEVEKLLVSMGYYESVRAEELSESDFEKLAGIFCNYSK